MEFLLQNWIGKVAVVTGASSGIGAAICEKLVDCGLIGLVCGLAIKAALDVKTDDLEVAQEDLVAPQGGFGRGTRKIWQIKFFMLLLNTGCPVAGLARNSNPINEMAKRLKQKKGSLHGFQCDITDEVKVVETLQEVKKLLGPVSVLVNNAGVLFNDTLLDGKVEDFKTSFDTNVMAKCIMNQVVIKQMEQNNVEGQIININSVLGHYVYDIPNMNVYPATQFAVTALSETLRLELIGKGSKIKITNLCPGPVNTKMIDPSNPLKDKIKAFLKPEDVADAVVYILSTPPHLQVQELIIRPVGETH